MMKLEPEHELLRDTLRKFTMNELDPWSEVIEEKGEVPSEVVDLLAQNGYLGMRLDPEFGGAGLSIFPYCLVLEEFSRSHRIFTLLALGTSGLAPIAIARHGTSEQKSKYLPGLVQGTMSTSFALTEPEAGSDPAGMKTTARKVEGGWLLNGSKHYISGAHRADFVMVMAVTDPEKRARGRVSAFIVDQGMPGFTVTRVDKTMASDAIQLAELSFDDCLLPDAALVGEPGNGFGMAMESLVDGRLSVACSCIGASDRLLEMSVEHAKTRHTFGKPLAARQAIQWMLADSAVELSAARALTYETLRRVEAGEDTGSAPSMCKLYCSEMVGRIADRAVQIHGGMGLVRSYPVERFYRDVRSYRIGEGPSEIQRMIIARDLVGHLDGKD